MNSNPLYALFYQGLRAEGARRTGRGNGGNRAAGSLLAMYKHQGLSPQRVQGITEEHLATVVRVRSLIAMLNECYSQRNTFAERAVHTANDTVSATKSDAWARHGLPFQMPSSSDTAYVSGKILATA